MRVIDRLSRVLRFNHLRFSGSLIKCDDEIAIFIIFCKIFDICKIKSDFSTTKLTNCIRMHLNKMIILRLLLSIDIYRKHGWILFYVFEVICYRIQQHRFTTTILTRYHQVRRLFIGNGYIEVLQMEQFVDMYILNEVIHTSILLIHQLLSQMRFFTIIYNIVYPLYKTWAFVPLGIVLIFFMEVVEMQN